MFPLIFMLVAPSGAGKTTLANRLLADKTLELRTQVSYTSRAPRAGEQDGVDYHFVDAATFQAMIEQDAFEEWALVHGNYYGTPKFEDTGADYLRVIDIQGALALQAKYPDRAVGLAVLPPSMAELRRRLEVRGTDTPEVIEKRLAIAHSELEQAAAFPYAVLNDAVDHAADDLALCIRASRMLQLCRNHLRRLNSPGAHHE